MTRSSYDPGMDERSIGAVLGALVTSLGWVLIDRLKRAKRIMPRTRVSLHLSMETPSSEPPADETTGGERSMEPPPFPGASMPPIVLTSGASGGPPTLRDLPAIVIHVESDRPIHAETIPPPRRQR